MRLIALDTHTPFIGGWCTILFIKSYSMTWSWKTYSLHLLNNLTGSWRNETIYTSFLWSQCHSYHDHGRARECRETLEILCRWNKYHFRNHLVLVKKFFHILPYGLQFTVPRGGEDPDCMRFQWIKMQQKTGWYFLVLSPNINAQVACRTHTFIFYFFICSLVYYRRYNSGRTKRWQSTRQASHVGGCWVSKASPAVPLPQHPDVLANAALRTPSFRFFMELLLSRRVWLKGASFYLFGCVGP